MASRFGRGVGIVGALALLPAPAWAAELLPLVLTGSAALLGLVVGGGAIGLWFLPQLGKLRRRQHDADIRIAGLAVERDAIRAVLGTWPGHFIAWTAQGQTCSPGLGAWLNLSPSITAFSQLQPAFSGTGFRQLSSAVETLRRDGNGFTLDLATPDGRILEAEGIMATDVAMITFRDVSPIRQAQRRDQAEIAELGRQRDHYRALLDSAPFPIWWRDADLKLAGCNVTYSRMVEATPDEVVARGVELASGLDADQPRRLAAKARDGGQPAQDMRRFVVAGDRRAYQMHEMPRGDGTLAGFGQDLTPLEEARAELARHVAAHAEVLQNLTTAIVIYGADKRLTLYNRAFARLWGLDESWLASAPHFGEVLEVLRENRQLPEQADWQSFKRNQVALFNSPETREELMHLPDGRTVRVLSSPHPMGGLVVTCEDVTDQLVLERARNTLMAVQRATLDNLYEGIVVYGSDGRVDLYNAAFRKLWDLKDEMLGGKPHITEVIDACRPLLDDGDDWPAHKEGLLGVFVERAPRSGRLDRPNGTVIDFASVPLPDGALLFTYLDITDSIRIERALRERNEALQAADQLKSEFLANVSYELRTPLNSIIGFAEILTNQYFGKLTARQKEYSQGILDSSHQLLMLINDILDLASIEAGQMTLETERVELRPTLEAILALVRERARRQELAVEIDCPANIGAVEADERRLRQVLFNLVSNAIKFTPTGGRVVLGARRGEREVDLWVQDNGVGIPAADQSRVFDKFQKSTAGGRQPGTGLGLSLVRSFVELHGGTVQLESAPERGTTVTCRLPVKQAAAPAGRAAAAAPSVASQEA
jgi:signal transduction histidine kinase